MENELKDIHLPLDMPWWPPALGWWLVAFFVIFAIALAIFTFRYFKKPTIKKQALALLEEIEKNFITTNDSNTCLAELSVLLRRVAISHKEHYAGITGSEWLQFLDKGLKKTAFSQGVGKILLTGPYQPHVNDEEIHQVIDLCRQWVERCGHV